MMLPISLSGDIVKLKFAFHLRKKQNIQLLVLPAYVTVHPEMSPIPEKHD